MRSLGIVSLIALAAALVPAAAGKPVEPSVIVVRNDSPRDLRRVELVQHGVPADRAARIGAVSPVAHGVEQSVMRSTNAPRLPRKVLVSWTDDAGKEFSETVDLGKVLKASQSPARRLVFRIGSGNELDVHVDGGSPD